MKKVSLFWCLGNLEAISFFSLFLTFTVQPPSVSRQRCHMNIRSGRCYLMKEERMGCGGGEKKRMGRGQGRVVVEIKAQYYKQRNGSRADSWQRSQNDWGKMKRVKTVWSGQKRKGGRRKKKKKRCQNDKQVTAGARNNFLHFTTTHLPLRALSFDLILPTPASRSGLLKTKWKIKEESDSLSVRRSTKRRKIMFFFFLDDSIHLIHKIFQLQEASKFFEEVQALIWKTESRKEPAGNNNIASHQNIKGPICYLFWDLYFSFRNLEERLARLMIQKTLQISRKENI